MTRITAKNPRMERLVLSAKVIIVHSEANGFSGKPLPQQCISPGAWSQGQVAYCTPQEYVLALVRRMPRAYAYWNREGWTVHITSNEWYDLTGSEL